MAGLYSHTTRANGTTLTASIYNTDHQNHINNFDPEMMDDQSPDVATMQTQTDPGEVGTESQPTAFSGEIERLRFAIAELKGTTYWYETANTSLNTIDAPQSENAILRIRVFA